MVKSISQPEKLKKLGLDEIPVLVSVTFQVYCPSPGVLFLKIVAAEILFLFFLYSF